MNNNCKDIQRALFKHFDKMKYPYFSCNTQALWQEADFVAVSRAFKITECEVKISRSDYFKDFKKEVKHLRMVSNHSKASMPSQWCVNYFYFAVPAGLVGCHEVPEYAGLLWIDEHGRTQVMKSAPMLHKTKTTEAVIIKLLRSIMYKYFK